MFVTVCVALQLGLLPCILLALACVALAFRSTWCGFKSRDLINERWRTGPCFQSCLYTGHTCLCSYFWCFGWHHRLVMKSFMAEVLSPLRECIACGLSCTVTSITIFICTFTRVLPNQKATGATSNSSQGQVKASASATRSWPQSLSTVHHFLLHPLVLYSLSGLRLSLPPSSVM